jgi:hypothetical protein
MAGWFDFVNGQTLPASRVQDYLMDQSVMVFASAAARTSALPTPTQGMVSYLSDVKALELYAGSAWQPVMQGRNAIINGGFDFWQRGTTTSGLGYLADRFVTGSTETVTTSQQTFSPGSPPFGYEAQYHARVAVTSVAGAGNFTQYEQRVEDVRTLAGQTVTFSYWAKADAAKSVAIELQQNFGSGGSATVNTFVAKPALTTSWARYSHTFVMPNLTGKTIGAGSYYGLRWWLSAGSNFNSRTSSLGQQNITFDVWGVQLESGSVATPFVRAATTLQGELAACQRYFYRMATIYGTAGMAAVRSSTLANPYIIHPVEMRVTPAFTVSASNAITIFGVGTHTSTAFGTFGSNPRATVMDVTSSGMTAGDAVLATITSGQSIDWSAEL